MMCCSLPLFAFRTRKKTEKFAAGTNVIVKPTGKKGGNIMIGRVVENYESLSRATIQLYGSDKTFNKFYKELDVGKNAIQDVLLNTKRYSDKTAYNFCMFKKLHSEYELKEEYQASDKFKEALKFSGEFSIRDYTDKNAEKMPN